MRKTSSIISLVVFLIIYTMSIPLYAGCGQAKEQETIVSPVDSCIIVLGAHKYIITASLHRDYEPVLPLGGKPMRGKVLIEDYDTETRYGPSAQWEVEDRVLLKNTAGQTWQSKFTIFDEESDYKSYRFLDGPKWESTAAIVTIRISLTYPESDEIKDKIYTLVLNNVEIFKTY